MTNKCDVFVGTREHKRSNQHSALRCFEREKFRANRDKKNDEIRRVGLTNVEGRGKATHAMQSRIYGNNIDERFHIVLICIHVASSSMAEDNVNASVRIHVYVKRMWLFFRMGNLNLLNTS